MRILALETAAKAVSAAITEDGKVLASGYQDTGLTHSRTLMPIVEGLLKNTGMTVGDLDAVAVSAGPGSFTGVRIGVSAAKGLAFAGDKPCIGVSTLAALARNVAFAGGLIVCAMDARRQQVYNALFEARDGAPARLTPDRAIALADLAEALRDDPRPKTVLGDGGQMCFDYLTAAGVPCRLAPAHLVKEDAVSVALEAEELARAGGLVTAQELAPVYLRPPQAERLRLERQGR
ncbi:tRNA (adenosine(37)-N6)-threonylcarbamoyltransferase complex dimerization subunit type 1 TsaB [uncultured Oscillibacter sp.]|uniref:tRNA (adenosine(37)-N6)-threonylcarbamoyltransferase complex dimerization subunit type 1 TsaB n=1 Tax=uncultured Oscillibacter sp. TaxID=876091 RepID=UPI0025F4F407|nr:tRNA (adenosine(37)-N6)-threonylcarbamoyltransferase complex dimerization subunit type 1 TsaB [uncultured Oscillibacter sp.]